MTFAPQFLILFIGIFQLPPHPLNHRMYHFVLFIQVVSELGFSFLRLLLGQLYFLFQLGDGVIIFLSEGLVFGLVVKDFLLGLFLGLDGLLLVLLEGFAEFSVLL